MGIILSRCARYEGAQLDFPMPEETGPGKDPGFSGEGNRRHRISVKPLNLILTGLG